MATPTLAVQGLGKRLTSELAESRRQGLRDVWDELRVAGPDRREELGRSEFWALRDVTFEVRPGEALGVIGANGAGKSTLLRLLHGITRPDEGSIAIRGPHAAMLSLGAPFNSVLSGRENIAVAAAVHGLPRRRLRELEQQVREFSELDDAMLDAPMLTYSSGMQLRLGYAIAAHLPARLLLVDEVIAVGDIGFQRKCLAHVRRHLAAGGSVVLVSHDLWMVQALCERTMVLAEGRIEDLAGTNHAISGYLRAARRLEVHIPRSHHHGEEDAGGPVEAEPLEVAVAWSSPEGEVANGAPLEIALTASGRREAPVRWRVDLLTANRQVCLARIESDEDLSLDGEERTVRAVVHALPLLPGTFFVRAHLHDATTGAELAASGAEPLEVGSRATRLDTLAQLPGAGALSSAVTTYSLLTSTSPADEAGRYAADGPRAEVERT